MSLWWVSRNQLDPEQIALIETLPLRETFLILGPPGCGKTNVLLRRAQFVRRQNMPNVLVLTFTRALTEFVRTGCRDAEGREIFPHECVTTIETWVRSLYRGHNEALPEDPDDLIEWKRRLAGGALEFAGRRRMPRYDALFIDEAQDLVQEEVDLVSSWSETIFFVGDDRQKIFGAAEGLRAVRQVVPPTHERTLRFHYRVAPPICRMADPAFAPDRPICILTVKGCKGLEFRALHWLFSDELSHYHENEDYYTVITRAKTSLDIYHTERLPEVLARAHSEDGIASW